MPAWFNTSRKNHGAKGRSKLNGRYIRDEYEQAAYLRELLDLFSAEGVDAAFVCTFLQWHLPHRDDPESDLDMGSVGIVKALEHDFGQTYPDMLWEPKPAFAAVAQCYERGSGPFPARDGV